MRFPIFLICLGFAACTPAENKDVPSTDPPRGNTPLFVVAGQSNAEGNVRLTGLQAVRDGLPDHDEALSDAERQAARAGYRTGIGDWCNPDEDYSQAAADAAIDALRAGGLDLSVVSEDYTIPGARGAAFRWRNQEASAPLADPYESPDANAHPAHTTDIVPFGIGFGVWDDEESTELFYGPELGFGMHLEQTDALPAFDVLKVAMGGSSLYEHWAPEGPMRRELFARTDAYLAADTDTYAAGLIWFQGFNDQFEEDSVAQYGDNLTHLIEDMRSRYGEVPVVIVEARRMGELERIVEAQQAVASQMDGVSSVESDGLTECFHYDAASQLVVGQRSAVAMLSLLD